MNGTVKPADISGQITTGGQPQVLDVAKKWRRGFWIQNLSNASLWVYEFGDATPSSPSLEIKAGQMYECPYGPPGALSIFGATTGQQWTARSW